MAVTPITQAFGLTHWKAAAPSRLIGRAAASALPSEAAVAMRQAR